jgi:hypothetical protein
VPMDLSMPHVTGKNMEGWRGGAAGLVTHHTTASTKPTKSTKSNRLAEESNASAGLPSGWWKICLHQLGGCGTCGALIAALQLAQPSLI